MDERQLKKALENLDIPAADENAKKRAVNLALAEFDETRKKTSQGISFLSRLMGTSTKDTRREKMEMISNKRLIKGGVMTAVGLMLFTAPIVYERTMETVGNNGAGVTAAKLNTVDFNTGGGNNFSSIAPNITRSESGIFGKKEKSGEVSQMYGDAMRKQNIQRQEQAIRQGGNAIPTPLARPDIAAASPPVSAPAESRMFSGEPGIAATMPYPVVSDDIMPVDEYKDIGRDNFADFEENQIKAVSAEPVSTFSIDVDTSSYSFIRRQINAGVLPQKDAVRIEEMINYFDYDYAPPETRDEPFRSTVTVTPSPWKDGSKLLHIGIRGYDIVQAEKPRSNLVFLIDTSGSMNAQDKLPLAIQSFKLLLESLQPDDTIGIVVYAGGAGTVLEPTKVSEKKKILTALDNLSAGGSTAGAEGIRQAYQLAEAGFDKDAVNRVILATDGDFNVGITDPEELKDFVERKRETGVFLSVLGFGEGNYNDLMMQELAQNGNGVAAYVDTLNEARKVMVEEAGSTLFPIAKDVKIQVEFNPATVAEYRLVGYETRHLNREDFNNDAVDAGDIGAGHTVTAIYEITPVGAPRAVDESRYAAQTEEHKADTDFGDEYAFLKIRYKLPGEDTSKLITTPVSSLTKTEMTAILAQETAWAASVASFGQLLKGGKYSGGMTYDDVITMAQQARGDDEFGYRAEFINLVRLAKSAAALRKN